MKKFTCFVIAILLVASVAILPAYAVETEESTMLQRSNAAAYAEKLAVRAFPEYADRITNDVVDFAAIATYRANNEDKIVIQETRAISEKEVITYTEYASGLRVTSVLLTPAKNVTDTVDGGSYTIYTLNAWMHCMGTNDILMVDNIKLRTNSDGSSKLVSEGCVSPISTTSGTMLWDMKETGKGDDSAFVTYRGTFTITVSIGSGENVTLVHGLLKVGISGGEPSVKGYDDGEYNKPIRNILG